MLTEVLVWCVCAVCGVLVRCAIGSDGCRVVMRRHALLRLA